MGTNYYLSVDICNCCKRPAKTLHMGKSSAGWKFMFRRYKDLNIFNVADWIILIKTKGNKIVDEYCEHISSAEFIDLIDSKIDDKSNFGFEHWSDGKYNYVDHDFL